MDFETRGDGLGILAIKSQVYFYVHVHAFGCLSCLICVREHYWESNEQCQESSRLLIDKCGKCYRAGSDLAG